MSKHPITIPAFCFLCELKSEMKKANMSKVKIPPVMKKYLNTDPCMMNKNPITDPPMMNKILSTIPTFLFICMLKSEMKVANLSEIKTV